MRKIGTVIVWPGLQLAQHASVGRRSSIPPRIWMAVAIATSDMGNCLCYGHLFISRRPLSMRNRCCNAARHVGGVLRKRESQPARRAVVTFQAYALGLHIHHMAGFDPLTRVRHSVRFIAAPIGPRRKPASGAPLRRHGSDRRCRARRQRGGRWSMPVSARHRGHGLSDRRAPPRRTFPLSSGFPAGAVADRTRRGNGPYGSSAGRSLPAS